MKIRWVAAEALTSPERLAQAERSRDLVFLRVEEGSERFTDAMTARVILYLCPHQLEPVQFQALSIAARAAGDEGFFLSVWELNAAEK